MCCFTTNLSLSLAVKEFLKVNIWQNYGQNDSLCHTSHLPCAFSSKIQNSLDVSTITCVWRTETVTNCCWRADSLDFIVNRYQTSEGQFWLTDWQTDAISDWPTADHVRHFAATSFFICCSICVQWLMWFLIWLMWTSFCYGTKYCLFHETNILKRFVEWLSLTRHFDALRAYCLSMAIF